MAMKKRPSFVLRFTTTDLRVAATRKQVAETGKEIVNKRPPVKPVVLLAPPIRGLAAAFSRRRWSFVGKERASIESTVRSVIHPFGGHLCKLPVRGRHRITNMIVLSAMMVNIRRITGYLFPEDGSKPIPDGYALC
jgi:hypothetical protein